MDIGIIEHHSKMLPLKALDQMYKALVRSHLDYCDIIYHIPSLQNQLSVGVTLSSLMEKAESIRYQTALAVTGAWQGSSRSKLYEELGWEAYIIAVCLVEFDKFIISLSIEGKIESAKKPQKAS